MRTAIPVSQGNLSLRFGCCDQFAVSDIDNEANKVITRKDATPHSE